MTGLTVVEPGLFSTVQDRGRTGYRGFGVPQGGVFDRGSADLANALLGNPPDAAVLELTLVGGTYRAPGPLALALAGAALEARVRTPAGQEREFRSPVCFPIGEGDTVVLGALTGGARAYLAVLGGWRTPVVLGSRSSETPVRRGDLLPCAGGWTPVRHPDQQFSPFNRDGSVTLRVIDGPDAGLVADGGRNRGAIHRVGARSDRMGLRLEGPEWGVAGAADRESTPVAPGAIQVAGGAPLVLGVACGTMGGYPYVAHVISADLDRLAQARPGDRLRFTRVTITEARRLDREDRRDRAGRRARVAAAAADRPDGPVIELAGSGGIG